MVLVRNKSERLQQVKKLLVKDSAKGIYRLTSSRETSIALISDWSKNGSGYTLYEVTCPHPKDWKKKDPKILCCPEFWRLIMAGGRFNTETESRYAPLEGELLGIASALHKSRYFTSGHPDLTIFTDHKPICNLFNDKTRQINNKRLSNLRRKCDGFLFNTVFARGIDNTTDAISRIKDWKEFDKDRFPSVDDNKDTDDNSVQEILTIKRQEKSAIKTATLSKFKTLSVNSNKLQILETMAEDWNTTLEKVKLEVLINMYASRNYDPDATSFSDDIAGMDAGRDVVLKDRNLAIFDRDSAIICKAEPKEDAKFSCEKTCKADKIAEEVVILDDSKLFQVNFVQDVNKVNSVNWDDDEAIQTEISGLKISDNWADPSEIVKTSSGIKIEDLSLYRNCLLVRDRIWVPEDLRQSFYNNLHLGHRGVDIMMRLALRSAYWVNMKSDLQYFLNDCSTCLDTQEKNKNYQKYRK